MSLERNKADIRIYACGGGGISIASKIYDWKNKALRATLKSPWMMRMSISLKSWMVKARKEDSMPKRVSFLSLPILSRITNRAA